MGRKIFVSYKYADDSVENLDKDWFFGNSKVRDYVDKLQEIIDDDDNINTGEKDGESLEDFKDEDIKTELKKRIFQSSITVVLISPKMKDESIIEKDQWIPWEISYSIRTVKRANSVSRPNAILGIILPDRDGNYEWYISYNDSCNCTTYQNNKTFQILHKNMFNLKSPQTRECNGITIHEGDGSYILTATWKDFKRTPNFYFDKSIEIRDKKEDYNLTRNLV